ncbi:MAG: RNA-binding S4 domain-containing protein [Pseudomonadota bacterium]
MTQAPGKLRVDKWLWHARFFKNRSLSADTVKRGALRINGVVSQKPASTVAPGDVLTFAQGNHIRVVEILALGVRRGPAPEAQALYNDLSSPARETEDKMPSNPSFDGKGRPTKKDRRAHDLSKSRYLE